jgi:hypothetical protein
MLSHHDVSALMAARHADPFGALGMHLQVGRLWVNALLPDAHAVDVVERNTQRLVGSLQRVGDSGVFSGALAGAKVAICKLLRANRDINPAAQFTFFQRTVAMLAVHSIKDAEIEVLCLPKIAILLGCYFDRKAWIGEQKCPHLRCQPSGGEVPANQHAHALSLTRATCYAFSG